MCVEEGGRGGLYGQLMWLVLNNYDVTVCIVLIGKCFFYVTVPTNSKMLLQSLIIEQQLFKNLLALFLCFLCLSSDP